MKYLNSEGVVTLWNKIKSFMGVANGFASLDANAKLKADQLPTFKTINEQSLIGEGNINIDLTLYKIVTDLPEAATADVTKIYLVVSTDSIDGNTYDEYIVIKGTDDTFKWEKLGSYRASVELTDYVKKNQIASTTQNGLMTTNQFTKLNGIAENATYDEAMTTEEIEAILAL